MFDEKAAEADPETDDLGSGENLRDRSAPTNVIVQSFAGFRERPEILAFVEFEGTRTKVLFF
jgi:hypothetical protein